MRGAETLPSFGVGSKVEVSCHGGDNCGRRLNPAKPLTSLVINDIHLLQHAGSNARGSGSDAVLSTIMEECLSGSGWPKGKPACG